jgi:hypothetical protein
MRLLKILSHILRGRDKLRAGMIWSQGRHELRRTNFLISRMRVTTGCSLWLRSCARMILINWGWLGIVAVMVMMIVMVMVIFESDFLVLKLNDNRLIYHYRCYMCLSIGRGRTLRHTLIIVWWVTTCIGILVLIRVKITVHAAFVVHHRLIKCLISMLHSLHDIWVILLVWPSHIHIYLLGVVCLASHSHVMRCILGLLKSSNELLVVVFNATNSIIDMLRELLPLWTMN